MSVPLHLFHWDEKLVWRFLGRALQEVSFELDDLWETSALAWLKDSWYFFYSQVNHLKSKYSRNEFISQCFIIKITGRKTILYLLQWRYLFCTVPIFWFSVYIILESVGGHFYRYSHRSNLGGPRPGEGMSDCRNENEEKELLKMMCEENDNFLKLEWHVLVVEVNHCIASQYHRFTPNCWAFFGQPMIIGLDNDAIQSISIHSQNIDISNKTSLQSLEMGIVDWLLDFLWAMSFGDVLPFR